KEIPLSPEAQAAIDLPKASATPQEIMHAILKAKVDLMWFGGIGTYIRATTETDADAGDRANDPVRVTGRQLRCKVIGEGANLGATQRGRIEAGRAGVRLNTDAIDNSAGVNSSDVEVNIKIAVTTPVADGRLTVPARNTLLASMTDDVAGIVLRNNYLQSLAVSLTEAKGVADVADSRRLMQALELEGRLDRKVEYLPEDMALDALEQQGLGLSRPEIAVLVAYAKLAFHDAVLESDVPDDPYFSSELRRYFPPALRDGYPDAVESHRLRREIISTGLANAVINRGGPSVAVLLAEDTGRPLADVARAYALTRDAFGVLDVNLAIDRMDAKVGGALQLELYIAVQRFTVDRMLWFMRNVDFSAGLASLVERFRAGLRATPTDADIGRWIQRGAPAELAVDVARLLSMAAAPEAVLVAERTGLGAGEAATLLRQLGVTLGVDRIRAAAASISPGDSHERRALVRIGEDLDRALRRIAAEAASKGGDADAAVTAWSAERAATVQRAARTLGESLTGPPSLARVSLAAAAIGDLAGG
ncbi:MAG: NAD-glutamate dehydrogenase domain-containing protein, partial [Beijerinckiaceae bacterium]